MLVSGTYMLIDILHSPSLVQELFMLLPQTHALTFYWQHCSDTHHLLRNVSLTLKYRVG